MKNIKRLQFVILVCVLFSTGISGCKKTDKIIQEQPGIIFNSEITYGILTDQNGIAYKTVTIGKQTWMAENLKTKNYRNGEPIELITMNHDWEATSTGAYCFYNNDEDSSKPLYGALYNWQAVDDSRNIAPVGWHIPSDAEWLTLVEYLANPATSGARLKETGNSHWNSPDTKPFEEATNATGFTALPGGSRNYNGEFTGKGQSGLWWTATGVNFNAWLWTMHYSNGFVGSSQIDKKSGFSVRCIKD